MRKRKQYYRIPSVPSVTIQFSHQGSEKIHETVNEEDEKEKIEENTAVISETPSPLPSHENEKKDEVCIYLQCYYLIA